MKTPLLYLLALLTMSTAHSYDLPEVSTGKIERLENFESQHIPPRTVDVWLPKNYSSAMKYSVLYMHDGQMLFDATKTWNGQEWAADEVVGSLIDQRKIPPCIIVGVWNGGESRWPDYYPQKPFEQLPKAYLKKLAGADGQSGPAATATVNSDAYLKFLVTELKPYIDSHYSTRNDREHTFIAGSSMGGLISMYAICEYPAVFGGAACISTHWIGAREMENNPMPDTFAAYLKSNIPCPETHKIYFDYGTETLDAYYEPHQLRIDDVMRAGGYDDNNWVTKKFDGANHSEDAWRVRLNIPLEFLMKE